MSAPSIPLHETDREMLAMLAQDYDTVTEQARHLQARADAITAYRQQYLKGLIHKAGAPLGVRYRTSPDGMVLAPVEPSPAPEG